MGLFPKTNGRNLLPFKEEKGVEAIMNGWRAAGIAEIVKQSRLGIVQDLNPFF